MQNCHISHRRLTVMRTFRKYKNPVAGLSTVLFMFALALSAVLAWHPKTGSDQDCDKVTFWAIPEPNHDVVYLKLDEEEVRPEEGSTSVEKLEVTKPWNGAKKITVNGEVQWKYKNDKGQTVVETVPFEITAELSEDCNQVLYDYGIEFWNNCDGHGV